MNKYLGYIDVLSFLDFKELDSQVFLKSGFQIDFLIQDTILLSCIDTLLVIGYSKIRDKWELLKRIDQVAGVVPSKITKV